MNHKKLNNRKSANILLSGLKKGQWYAKTIKLMSMLLLMGSVSSQASTSITTTTVSGHWTLSGSPYLVYNNIQVSSSTSLVIDPGVDIIFQGSYSWVINGILDATGTAAQPINLEVADTTGWWDITTSTGGWLGITFNNYFGTASDSSTLTYCNIVDVKIDSADAYGGQYRALKLYRALKVLNCNFTNNKGGGVTNLILANTQSSTDVFEIGGCAFYNNNFIGAVIEFSNYSGGSTYIHDNQVNHNSGQNIFSGGGANILFQSNEVDSNTSQTGTILLAPAYSTTSVNSNGTITDNKIHHNENQTDGAIWCLAGFIDIRNNLICNNQHISGMCGAVDGGGAVNIGHNATTPMDSTFYTLRNNIIANNYSPFHGGAVSIFHAKSVISNNQIVNNQSVEGAAIYMLDTMPLVCKNNICYGNIKTGYSVYSSPILEGLATANVEFTNNYEPHPSIIDLNGIMGGYTTIGDTSTNINGITPGMVMPTLTVGTAENALTADFNLLATSPCINEGDSAHAMSYITDYLHNQRISGTAIDMGAFEFQDTSALGSNNLQAGNQSKEIAVFPNPAVNMVYIKTEKAEGKVYILDMTGSMVAENQVAGNLTYVDLHALTRGQYIAVWINGKGETAQLPLSIE